MDGAETVHSSVAAASYVDGELSKAAEKIDLRYSTIFDNSTGLDGFDKKMS